MEGAMPTRFTGFLVPVLACLQATMEHAGKVGAFEGASYPSTGLSRPAADGIRFSRNRVVFRTVCPTAIDRVVDLHTRP
jgi:hypothetical protein